MKLFALTTTLLIACSSWAQTKISGRITDQKNRPVPNASVQIKDSYDGATADSNGVYQFVSTEKGNQLLQISSTGYKKVEIALSLGSSPIVQNAALKEELNELTAVTVTAGSFAAGDRKTASTVLSTMDIYTTGGANADVVAAAKTLPGAQQVNETEGLFVRGGTGSEAKQFIDGLLVDRPFNTGVPDIAARGRFAPNLFKGTIFNTGGYSAIYGQAMSSALILESVDLPDRSEVNASLSSVFVGLGTQQLSKNKKYSYGVNYGYTNLNMYFALVPQGPAFFRNPEFHNAEANFRFRTKRGGMVKYFTQFSAGATGLRRPNIDSLGLQNAFDLTNYNWFNNLSWRENLNGGWKMLAGLGYSTNTDHLGQQVQDAATSPIGIIASKPWLNNANFRIRQRSDLAQVRMVLEKRLNGLNTLRFGAEHFLSRNRIVFNQFNNLLTDNLSAGFAEVDYYVTNELATKAGVRAEYSSLLQRWNLAPRLSLAYKLGKGTQAGAAYGMFYQKPENAQLQFRQPLDFSRADHYLVNFIRNVNDRLFRVEAFYKTYHNLVKTVPALSNLGGGYARGVDLFFRDKKSIKGLDYWISYSYLDTKRDFLNYPGRIRPGFAADHTASVVVKRFITKISTGFNFTYSFATGRPYYNFQQDASGKSFIADQGRTIPFNSLGFSANYVTRIAKAFAVLVVSTTNTLNQRQIFTYNYNYNGTVKAPVTPPAPRFFFVGLFLSWGVDRTQDAINNNL